MSTATSQSRFSQRTLGLLAAGIFALVMAAINGDGSIERATPRTVWIGVRVR